MCCCHCRTGGGCVAHEYAGGGEGSCLGKAGVAGIRFVGDDVSDHGAGDGGIGGDRASGLDVVERDIEVQVVVPRRGVVEAVGMPDRAGVGQGG